ncbi:MAG: tripartite tricarboxylate transporter substrate binding protein [Burkholderiaceae bacterium]|nr:tripartite tricarboxylate transporter substrate binding protein [Burkholderiaceae bacterium]
MNTSSCPTRRAVSLPLTMLLSIGIFVSACLAAPATANTYPDKPIKLVAGTAPGGTVDKIARSLAKHLYARLGQPVVVDNRPGAGGTIAAEVLAAAAPDGYTLSINSLPTVAITPVMEKVRYNPMKDFQSISKIGSQQYVLLVPAGSKVQTVVDLVAQAKATPGGISYSSAGLGTGGHLAGELLSQMTGLQMLHVPYKGVAPAINDVIGGMVSITFATTGSSQGVVEGKKVRPIATTGKRRSQAYPNLPTMLESGFADYELSTWYGLSVPAKTPPAIVALLNREVNVWLSDKKVQEDFISDGVELQGGSPEEFTAFQIAEQQRWRKILERAGLAYAK